MALDNKLLTIAYRLYTIEDGEEEEDLLKCIIVVILSNLLVSLI